MNVFYRLPEGFPLEEAVQRFPQIFRPRQADSHKGTFGTLAVLGGAAGMSGAVVLASSSALMLGCGKVWAGFHQPVLPMPLIAAYPEIMLDTASALLKRTDLSARVAGCGLGCTAEAAQLLRAVFQTASDTPLLLDADALNLLAHDGALAAEAALYPQLVLTPHPAEAAPCSERRQASCSPTGKRRCCGWPNASVPWWC